MKSFFFVSLVFLVLIGDQERCCAIEVNASNRTNNDSISNFVDDTLSKYDTSRLSTHCMDARNSVGVISHMECKDEPSNVWNILNVLGGIFGAVLSGMIALWVYKKGEKYQNKQKEEEIKDFGEQIYELLKNSILIIEKQVRKIEEYCLQVEKEDWKMHVLYKVPHHNITRLSKLDSKLIFKTFKQLSISNREAIDLINRSDFLDEILTSIPLDYFDNISRFLKPYSDLFLQTRDQIQDYLSRNPMPENYLNINSDLNEIYSNYRSEYDPKVIDIHIDYNFFIQPIFDLFKDKPNGTMIVEILLMAKNATNYYYTVTNANEEFKKGLRSQLINIQESLSCFISIRDQLAKIYVENDQTQNK